MSDPEPTAECKACGHAVDLHTPGDRGDRSVGMIATGPYCEGSETCLCPAAVWFDPLSSKDAEIAALRGENERLRGVLSHIVNHCDQVTIRPEAECLSIEEARRALRGAEP